MWSFNRDGECDPALEADREEALGLNTAETRERRRDLTESAHPQRGVDLLEDDFTGTTPLDGVRDSGRR